jgi:hypothetical protein
VAQVHGITAVHQQDANLPDPEDPPLLPDAGQRCQLEDARPPPDIALKLVDLQSTPQGPTIQTYRITGRPQYETATT